MSTILYLVLVLIMTQYFEAKSNNVLYKTFSELAQELPVVWLT